MNPDYFTEAIKQIRLAAEEMKSDNDEAERKEKLRAMNEACFQKQRDKIYQLLASDNPEDWAKADYETQLLEGMYANPPSSIKTPLYLSEEQLEYLMNNAKK